LNNYVKQQSTNKELQKRLADAKQTVSKNYVRPSSANSKVQKNAFDKNQILMNYDNGGLIDFANLGRLNPMNSH